MNLFKNPESKRQRLVSDYMNYGNLIVGVDFDDTIRDYETGKIIDEVVDLLKEASRNNFIICLYTCREDRKLVEALNFCKGIGLQIDYVNCSPVLPGLRKPFFNILLDDRAGLVDTTELLKNIINDIKLINSTYVKE